MTGLIRKAYVDIREGQIHHHLRNGDGTPLLFLHQTASSSVMWEKVMSGWPGTHALYAIDTPGFGGSFDPRGAPDMARYRDWTVEVMDALALSRAHLVGHHIGSAIILALAAAQADRAASLAMIGASILTPDERAAFSGKLGHAFPLNRSGAYLLKNWEYLRIGGADQDMALLHREMIDMLRAWAARPHAYGAVWAQDTGLLLQVITCPAVPIAARDDILFPYLDRIAQSRPDFSHIILDDGGNFEPNLSPDALVAALADHISRAEAHNPG